MKNTRTPPPASRIGKPDAYTFCGPTTPASAISAGAVNSAGQPTKRFVKDLIRVGDFTGGGGSTQRFQVTANDHDPANGKFALSHWRDQFNAMRLAGIEVTMPLDHSNRTEDNRGFVRDMFIEGDTLYGITEAIGNDAIRLMSRAKVSINVMNSLASGNGKTYEYPIDHVAITTKPVVPDQRGFVAIAASNNQQARAHTLVLAASRTPDIAALTASMIADSTTGPEI